MNRFSAALFDLDGTLLNTLSDLTDAVNHTMSAMNCPLHSEEAVCGFVGNGIYKLIERALPPDFRQEESMKKAYAEFTRFYGEHCAEKTRPYPGIVELIDILREKGVPMSVVSNKDEAMSRLLCDRFFPEKFVCVTGGREGLPKKPDPTGVLSALRSMNVSAAETLYIGDSDVDYFTARNAGTAVASVSWGFCDRESLLSLRPDFLIDEAKELGWLF